MTAERLATLAAGPAARTQRIDLPAGRTKWDRPPPPHDWRFWVGGVGRTMIAVGILMFGFVAYQLWGTGVETARHQRSLGEQFAAALEAAPAVTAPVVTGRDTATSTPPPAVTVPDAATGEITVEVAPVDPEAAVPAEAQNLPPVDPGGAVARLQIAALDLDKYVVAGVSTADLRRGPGHFTDTPLPGQLGNSAIAGHRTTYGQPFFHLDRLAVGDEVVVTTLSGRFTYVVTAPPFVVEPEDYWVVSASDPSAATLTLTTCDPRWSAQRRLVVQTVLDPARSGPVGEAVLGYGGDDSTDGGTLPGEDPSASAVDTVAPAVDVVAPAVDTVAPAVETVAPGTTAVATDTAGAPAPVTSVADADGQEFGAVATPDAPGAIADAFGDGWFSDRAAFPQVALWGLVLTVVALASHRLSRRFRRDLVGFAVGILPFLVALYFFFQNVNRLLPPNL